MMTERGMTDKNAAGGPFRHIPVMLREVLDALSPRDGAIYVDGTFGAGGYARALLEAAACKVVAIDRDPEAIAAGSALARLFPGRLFLARGCYSDMLHHAVANGFDKVDGVALDIGASSMQFDTAERGFSFSHDGPLDMRMSSSGVSAADVVNRMDESDLANVLFILGEEKRSRAIARAIVAARTRRPIARTSELAGIVARVNSRRGVERKHPATRTFQALRAYVNCELDELESGLSAAETLLTAGGRLAVVTFHSLEDRIVKRFLAVATGQEEGVSRHMPENRVHRSATFVDVVRGGVVPSADEVADNPRSRSARLRTATRTAVPARGRSGRVSGLPPLPDLSAFLVS